MPQDKLLLLKEFLIDFSSKRRACKHQLNKLAGKLNCACKVIYGGRTFLRRILDQMSALKSPHPKLKLSSEFFKDLQWWLTFLETFNGKQRFLDESQVEDVQNDSSSMAAGAFSKVIGCIMCLLVIRHSIRTYILILRKYLLSILLL